MVLDRFSGRGVHKLCWKFMLAPAVKVHAQPGGFRLEAGDATLVLGFPAGLQGRVVDSHCSPSYGVKHPAPSLELAAEVSVEPEAVFELSLEPAPGLEERLREEGLRELRVAFSGDRGA